MLKESHVFFIFFIFLFFSCQYKKDSKKEVEISQFAQSKQGMVVAAQPLATAVGNKILEMGGNAADAAVATGFALAVVEPTMNGIGGRSQILVRKTDGSFQSYNAMTEIPASYVSPDSVVSSGHGTIAIPGVVAGLVKLHEVHGSLPLETVMEGAIELAIKGFEILPGEAARHKLAYENIRGDVGLSAQMLKGDSILYQAGERLIQVDLSQTLTRIAETGGRDFYEGKTALRIAEDMSANGGFLTVEDLAKYRVLDGRIVTTQYRGYVIHSIAAPAGGGLVIKALNLLEPFELSLMNPAEWALLINQALALAANSRYEDYYELDLQFVQDKEWAKKASENFIVPEPAAAEATVYRHGRQNMLLTNVDWSGDTWGEDSHHTTHFTTADCQGMVVSITQTVGPLFGSKVITPGLGFVYASTMGAYLSGSDQVPGSRPRTTIAPTIVTKDGETVLVLGAAGGIRILSGIVQTISRFIDQGMSLQAAVLAPRVHPMSVFDSLSGNYLGQGLQINAEFTPKNGWTAADSLRWVDAGFEVAPFERYGAFARVHALRYDKTSQLWTGVADADWEGTAMGPVKSICMTQ
tara:strand:- start:217 stop:1959 length:1743 start_codon:yes stop_codon:yes gene_type:complete